MIGRPQCDWREFCRDGKGLKASGTAFGRAVCDGRCRVVSCGILGLVLLFVVL